MGKKRASRSEIRVASLLDDMAIIYRVRSDSLKDNDTNIEDYTSDKRLAEYVIDWGRFWLENLWKGVEHAYRRKKT
jgi:hypothetical protein